MAQLERLQLQLDSAGDMDIRSFRVEEKIGSPFKVTLTARSPESNLELESIIGARARFDIGARRSWVGLVSEVELLRAEPHGLSTYRIEIVPRLGLLSRRRNHRIYQRLSEPAMALALLDEWKISYQARIDADGYKKRDYRVQYAETDFAFFSRMLEDAGITYWFERGDDDHVLVLSDSVHSSTPRSPIHAVDDTTAVALEEFVTEVTVGHKLRQGKYTLADLDYRIPTTHPLRATSSHGEGVEAALESFHYAPGAFLFEGRGDGTPTADDKLASRTSEAEASALTKRRLDAKRGEARTYSFRTNVLELSPGTRVGIMGHPRNDLGPERPVLITDTVIEGEATGRWSMSCSARSSEVPFRPRLRTPKPQVKGIESATIVGPAGEEIHTDEFGRVRVHSHWDRSDKRDDDSSCGRIVIQGGRCILQARTVEIEGQRISIHGDSVSIDAKEALKLSSGSTLELSGKPVLINGPGPGAARISDLVDGSRILTGSQNVFIGEGG